MTQQKQTEAEDIQQKLDQLIESMDQQLSKSRTKQSVNVHAASAKRSEAQAAGERTATHHSLAILFSIVVSASILMLLLIWFVWPEVQVTSSALLQQPPVSLQQPIAKPADESVQKSVAVVSDHVQGSVKLEQAVESTAAASEPSPKGEQVAETIRAPVVQAPLLLSVIVNSALIRTQPGKHGKVIARLKRGTRVTVLPGTAAWFQIKLSDGRVGWGHKDLFGSKARQSVVQPKKESAIASKAKVDTPMMQSAPMTGVAKSTQEKGIADELQKLAIRTISVNLGLIRDAPSSQGHVMLRLKKGSRVVTLFLQQQWYRVRLPDDRLGWAHRSLFEGS